MEKDEGDYVDSPLCSRAAIVSLIHRGWVHYSKSINYPVFKDLRVAHRHYPRLHCLPKPARTSQKLLLSSASGNAVIDCCPEPLPRNYFVSLILTHGLRDHTIGDSMRMKFITSRFAGQFDGAATSDHFEPCKMF